MHVVCYTLIHLGCIHLHFSSYLAHILEAILKEVGFVLTIILKYLSTRHFHIIEWKLCSYCLPP